MQRDVPPSGYAFDWVHRLSLVPKDLLSLGPKETLPVTVEHCEHLQNGMDNHCGGARATFRM